MKKIIALFVGLAFSLLCFSACTNHKPYQQYLQAYQKLKQTDSFIVENDGYLATSRHQTDSVAKEYLTAKATWQVSHKDNKIMAISNTVEKTEQDKRPTISKSYFRDGYMYSQSITDPKQKQGQKYKKADFPWNMAIEGVIYFPEKVIAKETMQDTPKGRLLTFTMDSEKYYKYRFPKTSAEYSYGKFSSYRKPPVYTVLLDKQNRIKQVTGHFCTVNSDSTAFTWDQSYTITFIQYGGVKLNFPKLNKADYPEI